MSNGKSLGSGGFTPAGSLINVVVIVLVVVVLILCAGVFLLYNQEKASSNDAKIAQDSYKTLNDSYNDLSGKYTAQVANNADLTERYGLLEGQLKNVSANYDALKNQSDTTTVKLGEFLENDPAVAYTYSIYANTTANNTTMMDLTVTVYNVGKSDANNVLVKCKIYSADLGADNSTSELTNSTATIPSLGKRTFFWELDNTTRVQSVWAGIV